MNLVASEAFGLYFRRLPLMKSAKIVHGKALRMDWADVVEKSGLSFISGNPPFVGAKFLDDRQRADTSVLFDGANSFGLLDYVSPWYQQVAKLAQGTTIKDAFVSTNSISQGEQPGGLWTELCKFGAKIHFAHRTFSWNNKARGNAADHCVIVGFGFDPISSPVIFDYEHLKSEPTPSSVQNINPYLVNAADTVLANRTIPICNSVPKIGIGNKPIDDSSCLFTTAQRDEFLLQAPGAAAWFRRKAASLAAWRHFLWKLTFRCAGLFNGEFSWC